MSRTLHTQPRSILAARRTAAPHRPRGDEPLALIGQRRLVRELGVDVPEDADDRPPVRIRVSRCRPGHFHPIGRRQIADALAFFGPLVSYGLRSVELRQAGGEAAGTPVAAKLMVPGRIVLQSVIRSAAAFGWRTIGLDDRHRVWFGVSRAARTEGRAAARSHRHATRVAPMGTDHPLGFKRVVVAGAWVDGAPLAGVDLAGGRDTLLVVPDEDGAGEFDWMSLGGRVEFARVTLPTDAFPYRYRLVASIVLAEAARQIGRPAVSGRPALRRGLTYESALEVASTGAWEEVLPLELRAY